MKDYAEIIVGHLLKLQRGDALSVNCEEEDFGLAKIIADVALEITMIQVKIVVTEKGKPVDVVEFDPPLNTVKPICPVFLRIAHVNATFDSETKLLNTVVDKDNLAALQKFGNLAEPVVLDRRIAVPYCVVPSKPVVYQKAVEQLVLENDYKRKFLNSTDIDSLHVTGESTDFTFDIPSENLFTDCHIRLSSGRDFISSSDFEIVKCIADKNSLNGTVSGIAGVFGKDVSVNLTFENGELVSFNDNSDLQTLFSFDEDLKKAGYFVLKDKASCLYLGGSLTDCLKTLPESEEKLPRWFNTSLYTVKIQLQSDCNITYKGCDGLETDLVRKGLFIR